MGGVAQATPPFARSILTETRKTLVVSGANHVANKMYLGQYYPSDAASYRIQLFILHYISRKAGIHLPATQSGSVVLNLRSRQQPV